MMMRIIVVPIYVLPSSFVNTSYLLSQAIDNVSIKHFICKCAFTIYFEIWNCTVFFWHLYYNTLPQLNASKIAAILLSMELRNIVECKPGKIYTTIY